MHCNYFFYVKYAQNKSLAAIIWYLAKGRHEGRRYGVRDWGEHVLDVADIHPTVNESDSDVSSCESIPEE